MYYFYYLLSLSEEQHQQYSTEEKTVKTEACFFQRQIQLELMSVSAYAKFLLDSSLKIIIDYIRLVEDNNLVFYMY